MKQESLSTSEEFVAALKEGAAEFSVSLDADELARLSAYYQLLDVWNRRLHLVAPCSAGEFAVRHVLESLLAVRFMPESAEVLDVGSGGGLPIVPCLAVRPDLRATLVEASARKCIFLREALHATGGSDRGRVLNERFERTERPRADLLTCRAIERFTEILPQMLAWTSEVRTLLLFGGHALREKLDELGVQYSMQLVPRSRERFLFVIGREGRE